MRPGNRRATQRCRSIATNGSCVSTASTRRVERESCAKSERIRLGDQLSRRRPRSLPLANLQPIATAWPTLSIAGSPARSTSPTRPASSTSGPPVTSARASAVFGSISSIGTTWRVGSNRSPTTGSSLYGASRSCAWCCARRSPTRSTSANSAVAPPLVWACLAMSRRRRASEM